MKESVVFYEGKASVYGFENKIICVSFHSIFFLPRVRGGFMSSGAEFYLFGELRVMVKGKVVSLGMRGKWR